MKIIDIKVPCFGEDRILIQVEYNSGKSGFVKVQNGKIVDFPLSDNVKKAVISLLKKDSYSWLKKKYYQFKALREQESDDYLFSLYTDNMEEALEIHKELKKVYM